MLARILFLKKILRIKKEAEDLSHCSAIIQPPKQWTDIKMHKIHKVSYDKVLDTNKDVYLA